MPDAPDTLWHRDVEYVRRGSLIDKALSGPMPIGGHHTIVARMNTDAVSLHLARFVERAMHGEPVSYPEIEAAKEELARVGYRCTWDEREHPVQP
jgi:hypothetical protein